MTSAATASAPAVLSAAAALCTLAPVVHVSSMSRTDSPARSVVRAVFPRIYGSLRERRSRPHRVAAGAGTRGLITRPRGSRSGCDSSHSTLLDGTVVTRASARRLPGGSGSLRGCTGSARPPQQAAAGTGALPSHDRACIAAGRCELPEGNAVRDGQDRVGEAGLVAARKHVPQPSVNVRQTLQHSQPSATAD